METQSYNSTEEIKTHLDKVFARGVRQVYSLGSKVLVLETSKEKTYLIHKGKSFVCRVVSNG